MTLVSFAGYTGRDVYQLTEQSFAHRHALRLHSMAGKTFPVDKLVELWKHHFPILGDPASCLQHAWVTESLHVRRRRNSCIHGADLCFQESFVQFPEPGPDTEDRETPLEDAGDDDEVSEAALKANASLLAVILFCNLCASLN